MTEERKCAWCGADISHKSKRAKYCGAKCKERSNTYRTAIKAGHWPKERQGPHRPSTCPECGCTFEQLDPRQVYCERGKYCAQSAFRRGEAWTAYISRDDIKARKREARRKYGASEHGRAAQKKRDAKPENVKRRKEYGASERGKTINRVNQRRRKAERARAMLLLPITRPPEV